MSAAVPIYIYGHTPSGQSRLYLVTQLRTNGVHCRESVVSKHNHCCTAAVHTVDPFPPPDLCLYKRRKLSVHGTVSYVVFQNIPGYDVLLLYTMDRFLPRRLLELVQVQTQTITSQERNTSLLWMPGGHVAIATAIQDGGIT